jgi:hypothetical protein
MSEQIYELAFYGKLIEGSDLQQTKEQIAQLFKTNLEQVERMFAGHRVVIRNKLDEETAKKYVIALQKRGADCQIEIMGQPGIAVNLNAPEQHSPQGEPARETMQPSASSPASTATSSTAQASAQPPRSEASAAPATKVAKAKPGMSATGLPIVGERVDDILSATHFDLAPVGSRMEDKKPEVVPDLHALDDVTLAPPGSVLVEKKEKPPVAIPDTSHLKLAPEDK